MKTTRHVLLVCASIASLMSAGCGGSLTPTASPPAISSGVDAHGISETSSHEMPTNGDDDIRIDSVPAGATVMLLAPKDDEPKGEDKVLGKTPLVVAPSQCPGMRFCVSMNMDEFIKQVEPIQEMKDWVARFKSEQFFGGSGFTSASEYFTFDTGQSQMLLTAQQTLLAVGPIYELDWPRENRVCALFIPREVKPPVLYSLMPKPETFPRLGGSWNQLLRSKYRLSEEQAMHAEECLTRCGKYVGTVKDPFRDGIGRQYSITVQSNGVISVASTEIRIIPGYND